MTEVERMVFASMAETLFIDEAKFKTLIADWNLQPEYKDGTLCGVVLTKGPEIHFVTQKIRQITRADLRNYLSPLIREYGYAMTRTPKKDVRQAKFNLLIGFEVVDEDAVDLIFKITHLKEKKSCQSSQ